MTATIIKPTRQGVLAAADRLGVTVTTERNDGWFGVNLIAPEGAVFVFTERATDWVENPTAAESWEEIAEILDRGLIGAPLPGQKTPLFPRDQRHLFTYGADHADVDGHPGLKRATLIEGVGESRARHLQNALHGNAWAFQYDGTDVERLLTKYYLADDARVEHIVIQNIGPKGA